MSGLLFNVTSVIFLAVLIASSISWIKLWEDHDYNLKRLSIYLRETKRGKSLLFGPQSIVKWILIFLYGITLFTSNFDGIYHAIVFIFYLVLFISACKKVFDREFNLPSITPATVSIFALSLLVEVFLFAFSPLDRFLWLLVIDKLLVVIIAGFVMVLNVFFDFNTDIIINRALAKINFRKDLLTIAVVGSFGRGSTREFISRVLSQKFNVLETRESFSNALGIAKTIVSGLTLKKQILIAEMNDYKNGDISEMANIINPKIAVVTGVNEQKMSEFGSLKKIMDSKYEVVEALSRDGIALFNADSPDALSLYERTKVKKFTYRVGNDKNADVIAKNIKELRYNLSFDIVVFGKKYSLAGVKLLGQHNIENLLPALFIGIYMGLDFSLIKKAIAEIKPLPGAMDPKKYKGAVLVDDTHNANINSVGRALSYMKLYRGRHIMVLEPLTELGKFSSEVHKEIGRQIGEACDVLFLTNDNYINSIQEGVREVSKSCRIIVASPAKITTYIKRECKTNDVVVFEGKEAATSLAYIPAEPVY